MVRRSLAREVALQLLFQRDQNKVEVARTAVIGFARDRLRDADLVEFAVGLADGVAAYRPAIDDLLSKTAENWRLSRMMPVDRNVLRMGAFELLHAAVPAPPAVVINEAIELARRFGTADSPGFVNGILDKIRTNAGSGMRDADGQPKSIGDLTAPSDAKASSS